MKTFKTQIYVNAATAAYCERAFGVRRHVWNWALNYFLNIKKQTNNLPSNYDAMKDYRIFLKSQPDKNFVWLAEQQVSARTAEEACKDIKAAFALVRQKSKRTNGSLKPRFKSKRDRLQTFSYYRAGPTVFRIDSDFTVSFEAGASRKRGIARTRESLAFLRHDNVKLCRMTITRQAGKYWMCISYEKPNQKKHTQTAQAGKVGIDLGVVISAAAYDGKTYKAEQFLTPKAAKSKRLSKKLNRKLTFMHYGSHRYEKAVQLKQRRELRSQLQRKAALEEYTTFLVRNYNDIVIDDFSFKSTLKVRKSDRRTHEKAYTSMVYEFKLRLEQKAAAAGATVRYVQHQKGIKTTHKCCRCGSTAVLVDRKTRILHCHTCNLEMDRDENAAINTFAL